ncbi:WbuC family cupin fold metalloprotein [Pseudoalteromonas aurantia]|uniref:Cupin fold metalloprotein WbuC cupin domain-containing protein n=1 Tax=Pseudoalteromonas aurantia 208 TaxID=1314867 RepID=A0ABR9EE82_9GAMM|nr:WbuC family cupin fold metalloprotein [Pseudoalteromonas aurantia]MBE0369249.1 hypothetical protein [Pseudoalteromonas aurantia 208]
MKSFTSSDCDTLFAQAESSEVMRAHKLLHDSHDDKVQRLLIAFVKGSYVAPHYHELPHQWEMFVVMRGELLIKTYSYLDEVKVVSETIAREGDILEVQPREAHSVECISNRALLLEIKEGPFQDKYAKVML